MKNYLYSELEKDQIKSLDKKVLQKSILNLQEDNRNLKVNLKKSKSIYRTIKKKSWSKWWIK